MTDEDLKARKSIGAQRNPDSEKAILDAAQAVLHEDGYAGFSIEKVAKRARAGKPTIYRWWPSKSALLLAVYHLQKRDLVTPDTGNVEEDLVLHLSNLFRQWRDTPAGDIFRSIVAEAQGDETASKALADYSADRRVYSGKIVQRAIARGEVDASVDPEMVADLTSSFAWTHLLTGRLDIPGDEIRRAVKIIVRGILA